MRGPLHSTFGAPPGTILERMTGASANLFSGPDHLITDDILDELMPPFPETETMQAFALLDAARDQRIYPALLRADCEWSCLYRGDAASTMAEVAPYLVQFDRASRFAPWVLEQGWGNGWGIFLNTTVTMEALRSHFRRFVMVQLPDGRSVYFRFYDPRVLRVYLPTCTAEELAAIFGPIERFIVEGAEGAALVFSSAEDGLEKRRLAPFVAG